MTQFIENAVCREAQFRAEQNAAVARAKKALRNADKGVGLLTAEGFLAGMAQRGWVHYTCAEPQLVSLYLDASAVDVVDDYIADLADVAVSKLGDIDGLEDIRAEPLVGLPQLSIDVDREATARVAGSRLDNSCSSR